jgi:hypothetical protein
MFPGRRKKEAKARAEKMRVALENSPEAIASFKQALVVQMMSTLGIRVYEWVSEKSGRRFVMESAPAEGNGSAPSGQRLSDGSKAPSSEGVTLFFEEEGKEVVPGFMK